MSDCKFYKEDELTFCVLFSGSNLLMQKTLNSLERQTCKEFHISIMDYASFRTTERNYMCRNNGYIMYLYNGFELSEDAVEIIYKAIEQSHSDWYYCDECLLEAKLNPQKYNYIFERPDFDLVRFSQNPDVGMGVVFSNNILKCMRLNHVCMKFYPMLQEMIIRAAMMAGGVHISKCLLTRTETQKPENTEDFELEMLSYRERMLTQFPYDMRKTLFPSVEPQGRLSIISISDSDFMYERDDLRQSPGVECLYVKKSNDLLSCYQRGVEQSEGDILCFIDSSCYMPTLNDLRCMQVYAEANNVGICSPCLLTNQDYLYLGVNDFAAESLRLSRSHSCIKTHYKDIFNIRQTTKPSYLFWMVRKETLQTALKSIDLVDAHNYSPDNIMTAIAFRLNELGKSNLFLGIFTEYVKETYRTFSSYGASELLFQYGNKYFLDRYSPECLRSYMRSNASDYELYFPTEYSAPKGGRYMLMISHELSLTGAPLVLVHAAKVLKEAGWQILVVSPKNGIARQEFLDIGIPVAIVGNMDSDDMWMPFVRTFDLVFVNTIVPFVQIEKLSSEKIPVMWWLHDARSGYENYLKNILPETVGDNIHIWSVSGYADQVIHDFRPLYKTGILHYGMTDESESISNLHSLFLGEEKRKVFVNVGTILHRKGQDILAQAIELLPSNIIDECLFLFVGKCIEKDIYNKIKECADKHSDNVRIISEISHDKIIALYNEAFAVVCSSRDDPLPTYMCETMMVSGVCICSSNTGTASIISDGINGFVYQDNDPKKLAICIEKVINHGNLQSVRMAGRKTYEEQFAINVFRANLLNCVEICMKGE